MYLGSLFGGLEYVPAQVLIGVCSKAPQLIQGYLGTSNEEEVPTDLRR